MSTKHKALMYNFRGVYGSTLTPEVAYHAGLLVGKHYRDVGGPPQPKVLIASDHRFSGGVVKHFAIQGLLRAGCRAIDAGILPTPVISWAASRLACGGCAVTASHNPPEYNGLKFFDGKGAVLHPDFEVSVLETAVADARRSPPPKDVRTEGYERMLSAQVMAQYMDDVASRVRVEAPLRVAIDCRLGMAGTAASDLLERLGCSVQALNDVPHPYFRDGAGNYVDPEPTARNLQELAETIRTGGFDLGLAFDGDCDRVVVVDEAGAPVLDDITLLLLARALGRQEQVRVVAMDISLMVEKWLRERGFPVRLTQVGDPYVALGLATCDASFGGVPNGHYLFPGFNGYSDGFYAAAVLTEIVSQAKRAGKPVSQLVSELPHTFMMKTKRPFGHSQGQFVRRVAPALRQLFEQMCGEVDYLQTDDAVVCSSTASKKVLVRFNRWDHQLNVQAESLTSPQEAQADMDVIGRALDSIVL